MMGEESSNSSMIPDSADQNSALPSLNPNTNTTTTTPSPLNPNTPVSVVHDTTTNNNVATSEIANDYSTDDFCIDLDFNDPEIGSLLYSPTPVSVVDNTTTNNNAATSEIASTGHYYVNNNINDYHVTTGTYDSLPSLLNPSLNPYTTTNNNAVVASEIANLDRTGYYYMDDGDEELYHCYNSIANTTTPVHNTATNNNVVWSDIANNVANSSSYYANNNIYPPHVSSAINDYPLNSRFHPYANTSKKVAASASTSNVANTSSYYVDNNMNPPHASSAINDYPLNSPFHPYANTSNNVVGSASTSNVASTSGVKNNNNMNLQRHFEFPAGFRFCPTDGELIYYYLQRWIMNWELPLDRIPVVVLYGTTASTPMKLSREYAPLGPDVWYFFTAREKKYKNGERPNRATGKVGFWKATGAEKPVHHPHIPGQVIGKKRTLVYYLGNERKINVIKTNWIMQEFMFEDKTTLKKKRVDDDDMELDWVLCKIYYNKNSKSSKGHQIQLEIGDEDMTQPEPEEAKMAALTRGAAGGF